MAFKFYIGSNSRPSGEVGIDKIDKEIIRSPRGNRRYRRELWNLSGMIQVSRTTEIDAAMLEFERQLLDGRDVRFVNANGKKTAHEIRSAETINGVNVVNLQWGSSQGAEHGVYRSYSLQLEAMFRIGGGDDLLEFRETLTFMGGGPEFVMITLSRGEPEKQDVVQRTPYTAIQSGSAVGESRFPNYPGPIWPAHWHRNRRIEEPSGPELVNGVFTNYGVRWQYEFESGKPLNGLPHRG